MRRGLQTAPLPVQGHSGPAPSAQTPHGTGPGAESGLPSQRPGKCPWPKKPRYCPKRAHLRLLSRRKTACPAAFQLERGAQQTRHSGHQSPGHGKAALTPSPTGVFSPVSRSPGRGRAALTPTHWGVQSSIHLQDKEPVFKQTRGMSAHTGLTAGMAVHAPTQRCICSHKAGEDKTSFNPQGPGAPLGRT